MTTAARRLHGFLEAVENGENTLVRDRWAVVLESDYGSPDFVRRHAAVMDLLHETLGVVRALPSSPTQERRLSYAHNWWRAVVVPEIHWLDGNARHSVIDQASLDMLDATAEYLEELDGPQPDASADDLATLRAQAEHSINLVSNAGLPRGLAASILDNLNNVIWLIDNADRFGTGAVVAAAESATGGMIRAGMATLQPRGWWRAVTNLVAAITLVAGGITQANAAIDQGQHMYQEIAALAQGEPDPDDAAKAPPANEADEPPAK